MSPDLFSRAAALATADLALTGEVPLAPGDLAPPRRILLTGATGFLGAATLARLLDVGVAEVTCLVRGDDATARLSSALAAAGGKAPDGRRVRIVAGDLSRPGLGLSRADRLALASEIDLVVHLGAEVNWAKSYDSLRTVNVASTVELARLCGDVRPKPLIFVSTLAGCYAQGAPAQVDESTDMTPFLEGMPLAYAQAKCVAESLLRTVASQGLPVTVLRSGLICSDSRTGRGNPSDIVSRLLCSAVRQGKAPDVDWAVDACPVDYVAEVLSSLVTRAHSGYRVLHLDHPSPRHWREVIAWLNVAGYPVSLVPYAEWLALVENTTVDSDPALHPLRPFFLARPRILGGGSLPELYFESNRRRINSTRTRAALEAAGLRPPPIDGVHLARSTNALRASGHLAAATRATSLPCSAPELKQSLTGILAEHFREPRLVVSSLERQEVEGGILGELFSWKLGTDAGVSKVRVTFLRSPKSPAEELTLIVKRKPADDVLLEVGEAVASACGPSLAAAFRAHARNLEFRHAQVREAAIYRLDVPSLRRRLPRNYGSSVEDGGRLVSLAIECLEASAVVDPGARQAWPENWVRLALLGAAEIHASFLNDGQAIAREPWFAPPPGPEAAAGLAPLWLALAEHAAPLFSEWWGEPSLPLQRKLIDDAPRWLASAREHPRTLVHNDFNPRNIAIRNDAGKASLCAFDWELATLDLPQRDLAELLCFVLSPGASREEAAGYVELHRAELERLSGTRLDRASWERGVGLALRQLVLSRLPLYVVYHRIRRQEFLPRVMATWRRLFRWFDREFAAE